MVIEITKKWHICCNAVLKRPPSSETLQSNVAFMKLWRNVHRLFAEKGLLDNVENTYLQFQEKIIFYFVDSLDTLSPICTFRFLDIVNIILANCLKASKSCPYYDKIAHYLLETLSIRIRTLLDQYNDVPSGFLGIAQKSISNSYVESGRSKLLRKLGLLLFYCCNINCKFGGK